MNGPDFEYFCQLVRSRSGLVLTADKGYLVTSRLQPVARAEQFGGVPEMLARLRLGAPEALIQRCVEAMATHESFFFRDDAPFKQFAELVLPGLIKRRAATRTLRIWCAACSSGQEPYSIAMVLKEAGAALAGWRLEIVGTDLSESILEKARNGVFSDFEARRGLSEQRLARWFTQEGAHSWRIAGDLKQMVSFRSHNLLHGQGNFGRFDVIFCRNVLIYFDVDQKRKVLFDLSKVLAEDGYLLLGSAETVIGITDAFTLTPAARGLYCLSREFRQAG